MQIWRDDKLLFNRNMKVKHWNEINRYFMYKIKYPKNMRKYKCIKQIAFMKYIAQVYSKPLSFFQIQDLSYTHKS